MAMTNATKNYGLGLFASSDQLEYQDWNNNATKTDTQMKVNADAIDAVKEVTTEHTATIAELSKNTSDAIESVTNLWDEVSQMSTTVTHLESGVVENKVDITNIKTDVTNLGNSVRDLNDKVNLNTSSITGLNSAVTDLNEKVTDLENGGGGGGGGAVPVDVKDITTMKTNISKNSAERFLNEKNNIGVNVDVSFGSAGNGIGSPAIKLAFNVIDPNVTLSDFLSLTLTINFNTTGKTGKLGSAGICIVQKGNTFNFDKDTEIFTGEACILEENSLSIKITKFTLDSTRSLRVLLPKEVIIAPITTDNVSSYYKNVKKEYVNSVSLLNYQ